MSLYDDLLSTKTLPVRCPVALLTKALPAEDLPDAQRGITEQAESGNYVISATVISRVLLERNGIKISAAAINRHRRSECGC